MRRDSGDGFETVLADLAGVVQFEVQSRGAMGQVGDVRGAADGINDARRNHCRRCVRCVRHGSSLLPYATVFHYRRWVPQKHGNAGKASRNGNYALRCSAIASAMVFRRTRSPYLPQRPFRLHSTMQNPAIVVKNHRFLPPIRSVATEKVVSYLSHTLRSRLLLKMRQDWSDVEFAYRNMRIPRCSRSFLFSGDFRQSKPDLACGRGATRQARPVNGERTRQ